METITTEQLLGLSCDELSSTTAPTTKLEQFLADCPGFVGEIARSVDASLKHSRPSISLPAALAFCAAIKSGRVVSDNEIECNLYVLSLAPTGFGKTRAQNALEKIAEQAGIQGLFGLEPTSDAGLIAGLALQNRQFILWDEFGEALDDLASAKNSPKATVLSSMTMAFSASGRTLRGKQYADGHKVEASNVYLSVFGVSNEYSFFNALNEKFLYNGFLSRWLCFAPDTSKTKRRTAQPASLSPECLHWLSNVDIWSPAKGNIAAAIKKDKRIVALSSCDLYLAGNEYFDDLFENSKKELDKAFWSRGAELFTKLCLVFTDKKPDWEHVRYCWDLTEYLISTQIQRCKESVTGSSDKAKAKAKLPKLLEVGEEVTQTELGDRLSRLGLYKSEEQDIIHRLLETKKWSRDFRHASPESVKKTTYFRRLK